MGDLNDFTLHIRAFLMSYKWRRIEPIPWTPLKKPLNASRLAIISSAGFVLKDQTPFDAHVEAGDDSFREIPYDTNVKDLIDTHKSKCFDHSGMQADPNLAIPLDRVRELEAMGLIGSVARNHLSFMGSITAPLRLIRKIAPEAAHVLVSDNVDVALLVPV
jgi:D-proline reductase (dithiol) PrdB